MQNYFHLKHTVLLLGLLIPAAKAKAKAISANTMPNKHSLKTTTEKRAEQSSFFVPRKTL